DLDLAAGTEQLGIDAEAPAELFGEGVNKPEPGVVPGPDVLGTGIAQSDDEAKASHQNADSARCGRDRGAHRTTVLLGVLLDLGGRDLGRTGVVARLRLDAALARDDHGDVVLLAQLQLGDLDALGQLQRRQVDDLVDGQLGQVDLDELRQVLRQAADFDLGQFLHHDHVGGLAGRRQLFVDEVQRDRGAQRLVGADALEVQMHDQLAVRVALHVAQQDLLDLAVDVEVQDRRVEPLVLAGQPDVLVLELDGLRLGLAAVDDGRDLGGMTQAAARTLTFVSTAGGLDGVFGHFRYSLCLLWTASRRLETLTRDQASVLRAGLPAPRNRVDRRGSIDVEGTHRFAERDAPDGFGQQFGDAELAHLAALAR